MTEPQPLSTFDRLIALHDQGNLNETLTKAMADAIERLVELHGEHRSKLSATVGVDFKIIISDGEIEISGAPKVKLPLDPQPRRHYFLTADNRLTQRDPRQPNLPLREVEPDARKIRTP